MSFSQKRPHRSIPPPGPCVCTQSRSRLWLSPKPLSKKLPIPGPGLPIHASLSSLGSARVPISSGKLQEIGCSGPSDSISSILHTGCSKQTLRPHSHPYQTEDPRRQELPLQGPPQLPLPPHHFINTHQAPRLQLHPTGPWAEKQ